MISFRVIPIGTSTKPVLLILPTSENTFVPLLSSVPILANQPAPLLIITGTVVQVSTLFIMVGFPHSPDSTGYGGLCFGSGGRPSIEAISEVSSPQTNAPAPCLICISKLKSVSNIFSPISPYSFACLIAIFNLSIASGYSPLI